MATTKEATTRTKRQRRFERELNRTRLFLSNGELPIDGLASPKATFRGERTVNLFSAADHIRVSDPKTGIISKVEFSDGETRAYAQLLGFRTAVQTAFGEETYKKMRQVTKGS